MTGSPALQTFWDALYRLAGDRSKSDAVQTAFLQLWENTAGRAEIEAMGPALQAMLKKTLGRVLIDRWREAHAEKRSGAVSLDGVDPVAEETPTPERAIARELDDLLQAAVDKLGEPHRAIILLRFYECLNKTQIAGVLRINRNSVSKLLDEALEAMLLAITAY